MRSSSVPNVYDFKPDPKAFEGLLEVRLEYDHARHRLFLRKTIPLAFSAELFVKRENPDFLPHLGKGKDAYVFEGRKVLRHHYLRTHITLTERGLAARTAEGQSIELEPHLKELFRKELAKILEGHPEGQFKEKFREWSDRHLK